MNEQAIVFPYSGVMYDLVGLGYPSLFGNIDMSYPITRTVEGSVKRRSPGCVSAAGKAKQKW